MTSLCCDWQGEWLLLFNYLIPFSELLDQSGQALDVDSGGARVSIKTEQVGSPSAVVLPLETRRCSCNAADLVPQICKFLVSLSKDFSSYYNRVHVLGVRMPLYSIHSQLPVHQVHVPSESYSLPIPRLSLLLSRSRCLISLTRCFVACICWERCESCTTALWTPSPCPPSGSYSLDNPLQLGSLLALPPPLCSASLSL